MRPTNWRSRCLALLAPVVLLIVNASGDVPVAAQDKPAARKGDGAERQKALLEVSRKGYEEAMDTYRQTQRSGQSIKPWVNVDQVYTWSVRWLRTDTVGRNKNNNVAAFEAHLRRMQRLEKVAKELRDAELVIRVEPLSAEFYRLEAEGWLADEKAK
jgi:hypothetical protein